MREMAGESDSARYEREREFHDARFAEDTRPANRFYGAAFDSAGEFLSATIDSLPRDTHVLDFGCGSGAYVAIGAAQGGRTAAAFDLSPVAVSEARQRAEELGVADRIDFHVMNAERLDLPFGSFDLIAGNGILHHLDLRRAYEQLARLLRPDGRAVFLEPLGHNPIINLYRRRTPEQRTPDEHPLLVDDFELAREYFEVVEPNYFGLTSLVTLPFSGARRSGRLVQRLDAVDDAILRRAPRLGRYAWLVALDMRNPRRARRGAS